MDEARYSILFDGVTLAGMPDRIVKANLAQLFKRDPSEIDALFSNEAVVLKRGLTAEEAASYIHDLRQAGAIARKTREIPEKPVPPKPAVLSLVEDPTRDKQPASTANANTTGAPKAGQAATGNPWDSPADFWGAPAASSAPSSSASLDNARSRPSDLRQDDFFGGGTANTPRRPPPSSGGDYCELKYITLEGRLGRIRYIGWALGGYLAILAGVLCIAILGALMGKLALVFGFVLAVTATVFYITLTVRRLHDVNLSGWWLLLLVAVSIAIVATGPSPAAPPSAEFAAFAKRIGTLVFIVSAFSLFLYLKGGTAGDNNYGPPPPPNGLGVTILAVLSIIFSICAGIQSFNNGFEQNLNQNIQDAPATEPEA